MFVLAQCGPTRGDCTAPYRVHLDKEYTVTELVDAIITNNPEEWGNIKLGNILGKTICSYRWGKITVPIAEQYKDQKIITISADGGWSAMDYIITVSPISKPAPRPTPVTKDQEHPPKNYHPRKGHVIA